VNTSVFNLPRLGKHLFQDGYHLKDYKSNVKSYD
jgi:hypothetical protein